MDNAILLSLEDKEQWNSVLKDIKFSVFHTWEYCFAMAKSTNYRIYLYVNEYGKTKMVCPVGIRIKERGFSDLVSPYGFGGIIYNTNLREEIDELKNRWDCFWNKKGFVTAYIVQHPCFLIPKFSWEKDIFNHRRLYLLDLSLSLQELWKNMHKGHKYDLKKKINNDQLEIKEIKKPDKAFVSQIHRLYIENMKRLNASKVYLFKLDTFIQLIKNVNSILLAGFLKEELIIVSWFLYTPWVAEYFISFSTNKGRKYSKLLVWKAIEKLKLLNVNMLHLGGGIKDGDSLDDFKRRFGARLVINQSIKQIFNLNKYEYLCRKYCSVHELRDFFPPYWA